ncbi:MAG: sigma-70 family RNA polymerase sigma factor [Planctomycetota bacterium]
MDLGARLVALHAETGDATLLELANDLGAIIAEGRADKAILEAFRDRLSTRLMDCYRVTASGEAFGLLYELNYRLFANVIQARLRKFYFQLDVQDVLQEVFFNIYRYPHKFQADKDQAFRHWASTIIRNTVYKSTRDKDREINREVQDEEIETRADEHRQGPLLEVMHEESREWCTGAYLLVLQLYLAAFDELSERERTALRIVELDGEPYKVAATQLGIRLENLKMVIFRARKKILRQVERTLAQGQGEPEVPPARPEVRVERARPIDRRRLASAGDSRFALPRSLKHAETAGQDGMSAGGALS